MYKLLIPIESKPLSEEGKTALVRQLKRAKVDEVFLIFHRIICNADMLEEHKRNFIERKTFLEENGFKVNAWLAPTIGYGGVGYPYEGDNDAPNRFTRIKFSKGDEVFSYCPLDDGFVSEFTKTIKAVCETGVSLILFEDDFTLSGGKVWADIGCCCERHMAEYQKRIGEKMEMKDLRQYLVTGGKNKYRDCWLSLQGETLKNFSAKIEKAAHLVNPDVRIGLSANSSSYTLEGVTIPELAHIIAGKNKPFMRLTGAPYWKNAITLAPNIDAIRLEAYWCGKDIETVSEGDPFPRPRHWIPAAYLECYDMILRAAGTTDGIMKYMLDYTSSADYETGYVDRHVRNEANYKEIERRFSGKTAVGLNVFENMGLYGEKELSDGLTFETFGDRNYLPTLSQWMMCDNSIPLCYGGENCASIVFGENANYATDEMLENGVIIDVKAAELLMRKGVDIGIESMTRAKTPTLERFNSGEVTTVMIGREGTFYNFVLSEGAKVLSTFLVTGSGLTPGADSENTESFTACYLYENAKHQKFMVYAFNPLTVYVTNFWHNGLFRNYCRQKQLADGISWLQGKALPAMCFKNPDLYILCKKDNDSMAVGIWNIFADTVFTPEIQLDGEYKKIDFYNCSGHLSGNKVILENDIIPYGFAFFTVYR